MTDGAEYLLTDIRNRLERIEELLSGNGEPEKGVIVRLDRVERFVKIMLWAVGAVFTFVGSAVAGWYFS